jgi:hypothetical protein
LDDVEGGRLKIQVAASADTDLEPGLCVTLQVRDDDRVLEPHRS